ncbi:hypothetical protein LA080_008828 [Diaporthe eres]|nr:hypothetical protein LA080_008828 [Diaporthe eres]
MLIMVQPLPHRGARSWPPEQGTEGYVWHGGPDSYLLALLAPTNQSSRPASSPCSITCPPVENLCPPCLISEMKVAPRPGLSPSAPEDAMRPGTNMLFIAHAQEKLDDLSGWEERDGRTSRSGLWGWVWATAAAAGEGWNENDVMRLIGCLLPIAGLGHENGL